MPQYSCDPLSKYILTAPPRPDLGSNAGTAGAEGMTTAIGINPAVPRSVAVPVFQQGSSDRRSKTDCDGDRLEAGRERTGLAAKDS